METSHIAPPPLDAEPSPEEQDLDRQAFGSLAAQRSALTTLARRLVDGALVAAGALQLAQSLTEAERALFALLDGRLFQPHHLSELEARARATRYAARKLRQAKALGDDTRRRLPAAVVEPAAALRATMLQVLDYNLGDDAVVARQLDAIRAGSGYQDLANDLDDLADLYDAHTEALSADRRRYDAADADRARALSRALIEQLDVQRRSDIKAWGEDLDRAWTLLITSYTKVRNAALFIWQDDPATLDRFPPPRVLADRLRPQKPAKKP